MGGAAVVADESAARGQDSHKRVGIFQCENRGVFRKRNPVAARPLLKLHRPDNKTCGLTPLDQCACERLVVFARPALRATAATRMNHKDIARATRRMEHSSAPGVLNLRRRSNRQTSQVGPRAFGYQKPLLFKLRCPLIENVPLAAIGAWVNAENRGAIAGQQALMQRSLNVTQKTDHAPPLKHLP